MGDDIGLVVVTQHWHVIWLLCTVRDRRSERTLALSILGTAQNKCDTTYDAKSAGALHGGSAGTAQQQTAVAMPANTRVVELGREHYPLESTLTNFGGPRFSDFPALYPGFFYPSY